MDQPVDLMEKRDNDGISPLGSIRQNRNSIDSILLRTIIKTDIQSKLYSLTHGNKILNYLELTNFNKQCLYLFIIIKCVSIKSSPYNILKDD